jgi:hypothetical protein
LIRACECGRAKENRGPKSRQLVSAVGVVSIKRRYWKCRCGAVGSYAVDDVLGLSGRFSQTLQKHSCRLAADVSFAKTREHLREMLGVSVSVETLRTQVESHGRSMAKFQLKDEATAKAFTAAKGEMELTVDAGKVNTWEEKWKDLKIVVALKRESGDPAAPNEWQSDRLPDPTVSMAFAMIAASKVFRRTWGPSLRHLGVKSFATVHALGDGASWIWNSLDRAVPGCIQTLDVYHASARLSRCAQAIFGEASVETTTAFERGRELLVKDGWAGVCAWVGELLSVEDVAERERRRPATEKLLNYFSKHVGRLNYRERLASGRAIGSGAVEGQAKTLGLRLKARGARWRKKNVRPMASLVCVRNSIQWESYWLAV